MTRPTTYTFLAQHPEHGRVALLVTDVDAFVHAPPNAALAAYVDDGDQGDERLVVIAKRDLTDIRPSGTS